MTGNEFVSRKATTVRLFSNDGGETYCGLSLGALMERGDAEKALDPAAEAARIDPDTVKALGICYRDDAGELTGAVGVNFSPPLPLETSAVFAGVLTVHANISAIELCTVGDRDKSLGRVPILAAVEKPAPILRLQG